MNIEPLEPRIAPASVLTFTDVDGDLVKITASKGDLTGKATVVNGQLRLLDLRDAGFDGANISTSVTKVPGGNGDGLVNIGAIDAYGRDLGKVTIKGDLGSINVGDFNEDPAAKVLSVHSLGVFGLQTQGGAGTLICQFAGDLGTLRVAGDVVGAQITTYVAWFLPRYEFGSVFIGGDVKGNAEDASGSLSAGRIHSLSIKGDLTGGGGQRSGAITTYEINTVSIGGSVIGNSGNNSGKITASFRGPVKIGGELQGGAGIASGSIFTTGELASLTIGGMVRGGGGESSGSIQAGKMGKVLLESGVRGGGGLTSGSIISADLEGNPASTDGSIKSLTIRGSVEGGGGEWSASLQASGNVGSVRIGGDLRGGSADCTGGLFASSGAGSVQVGGSLIGAGGSESGTIELGEVKKLSIKFGVFGGSGERSGAIEIPGNIGSLTIGTSLVGGSGPSSGLIDSEEIGTLRIGKDIVGGSLSAGKPTLSKSAYIVADSIKTLFVGGSIRSGFDGSAEGELLNNASIRVNHSLGAVTVKGDIVGRVDVPVIISAEGQKTLAASAKTDLAIRSLTVGGKMEYAFVLAGFDVLAKPSAAGSNGDASIGAVKVGGDWVTSSIAAGTSDATGDGFGINDQPSPGDRDELTAKIASITIGGELHGSYGSYRYGFSAEKIGSFKAKGYKAPLTAGADTIDIPTAFGKSLRLNEV